MKPISVVWIKASHPLHFKFGKCARTFHWECWWHFATLINDKDKESKVQDGSVDVKSLWFRFARLQWPFPNTLVRIYTAPQGRLCIHMLSWRIPVFHMPLLVLLQSHKCIKNEKKAVMPKGFLWDTQVRRISNSTITVQITFWHYGMNDYSSIATIFDKWMSIKGWLWAS